MLHLIDFGAAREYPLRFIHPYLKMVAACANRDSTGVVELSRELGFLSGDESKASARDWIDSCEFVKHIGYWLYW